MFDMCLLLRSGGRSKRQHKRFRDTWYRVRVWLRARTYTSTERYRRRAYSKYFDAAIREHDAMVVCVCVWCLQVDLWRPLWHGRKAM